MYNLQPGYSPAALRERATQARRLALIANDPALQHELMAIATKLDAQAEAMERREG